MATSKSPAKTTLAQPARARLGMTCGKQAPSVAYLVAEVAGIPLGERDGAKLPIGAMNLEHVFVVLCRRKPRGWVGDVAA